MTRTAKHFAHALIEHDGTKFQRGDELPADLPGLDELVEGGAASTDEYVDHRDIETGDAGGSEEGTK